MSTQHAAAGRYRNRDGSDLIQYVQGNGTMLFKIDNEGWVYTPMVVFPDGSSQSTAASTTGTNIDAGTF